MSDSGLVLMGVERHEEYGKPAVPNPQHRGVHHVADDAAKIRNRMLDPVSDRLSQRSLNNVFREANEAGLVLVLSRREQVVPDRLELPDIRQRGGRRLVVDRDVAR